MVQYGTPGREAHMFNHRPSGKLSSAPSAAFAKRHYERDVPAASSFTRVELEAPPGFEPGVEVLQTSALPLGDGASRGKCSGRPVDVT
jgi:hypothetical protein